MRLTGTISSKTFFWVVPVYLSLTLLGCINDSKTGGEESFLSQGVWENQHTYLDNHDSVMAKITIQILASGKIDFRNGIYDKDQSGQYSKLFDFTRVLGTYKLLNDSLIIFGETIQDTCCDVMTYVDLNALPKRDVPSNLRRSGEKIRNITSSKFEVLMDDGADVSWLQFSKK